jgi:hypothetical protein
MALIYSDLNLPFATDVDASPSHSDTLYDLIANVVHESVAGTARDREHTVWKVHLRAGSGGGEGEKWYQIQDLIVEETRKEIIFLGETVLQVRSRCLIGVRCQLNGDDSQIWERRNPDNLKMAL